MKVAVIDYAAGNICSVQYALQRLGVPSVVTSDMAEIMAADKVIFPGVGQASSAMQQLRARSLDKVIPVLKQPVLGICLGMQLLCEYTEEGQTEGLGVFSGRAQRIADVVKVPHMGWNQIEDVKSRLFKGIGDEAYVYFVHGYAIPKTENTIATSLYGGYFSAALRKNNFYACQFHPEKSGETGLQILKNFIDL